MNSKMTTNSPLSANEPKKEEFYNSFKDTNFIQWWINNICDLITCEGGNWLMFFSRFDVSFPLPLPSSLSEITEQALGAGNGFNAGVTRQSPPRAVMALLQKPVSAEAGG